MRRLHYTVLPGSGPGEFSEEGTVADILFALPYLIGFGSPFPSHAQLNSLLCTGYVDAAMSGGCEWEPFEVGADEYTKVARAIEQDPRLASRPVPSLHGSDAWARDIAHGYSRWDMDKGGWASDGDPPPRLADIEDIPF